VGHLVAWTSMTGSRTPLIVGIGTPSSAPNCPCSPPFGRKLHTIGNIIAHQELTSTLSATTIHSWPAANVPVFSPYTPRGGGGRGQQLTPQQYPPPPPEKGRPSPPPGGTTAADPTSQRHVDQSHPLKSANLSATCYSAQHHNGSCPGNLRQKWPPQLPAS
jgi:hypothetical protein